MYVLERYINKDYYYYDYYVIDSGIDVAVEWHYNAVQYNKLLHT